MRTFAIPINRSAFENARERLSIEQGITLTGDTGEIEHDTLLGNVKVGYSYRPDVLVVTIEEAPMFSSGKVEKTVREWFDGTKE